jgi:undecaprenyl-diphosphatase
VLGYIFWQSFDQVTKIAGRATLVFTVLVAIGVGVWQLRKRLRDPDERARIVGWLERQGERPLLRPVAAMVRVAAPRVRFLAERLTPGALGLEFTTALAVAAVGAYAFIAYTVTFAGDPNVLTPADSSLLKLADRTKTSSIVDIVKVYTDLGSLPVTGTCVAIGAIALAIRRRPIELISLVFGFVALVILLHVTKAAIDRPRPSGSLIDTIGSSFPSAHAGYSTVYVAMAAIGWRVVPGFTRRALVVLGALLLSASIGMSRIYLRAHYWSDVAGGWALGAAIFGACAVVALVVMYMRDTAPARAEA